MAPRRTKGPIGTGMRDGSICCGASLTQRMACFRRNGPLRYGLASAIELQVRPRAPVYAGPHFFICGGQLQPDPPRNTTSLGGVSMLEQH
jgi:hypothetical protein